MSRDVRQILIEVQGEIDESTLTVGNLNSSVSEMDRSSKNIVELNNTINQLYIMDIYRLLQPRTVEYTFLSDSSGTYTKENHILDHKTYLNKFKRIEII